MKNLLMALLAFSIVACGQSTDQTADQEDTGTNQVEATDPKSSIMGSWTLASVTHTETEEAFELKECDLQTVWEFTDVAMEPLGDGTPVMKVVATAPESCEFFGFESKWTTTGEQLFIASTRIGGIGGISHAGLFKMIEVTSTKMVLEILRHRYVFER